MAAAKVAVAKSERRVVVTFMLSLDAVRLWLGYSRLMEMACLRDKVIYVYIHLNSQRGQMKAIIHVKLDSADPIIERRLLEMIR